ncbi:MAG: hypothetical protein ACYCOR_19190 [Acidobacteriaceae bacterium]
MRHLFKPVLRVLGFAVCLFGLAGGAQRVRADTLYLSLGRATANTSLDQKSAAWSVDDSGLGAAQMLDLGYINTGHEAGKKKDGLYALAVARRRCGALSLFVGAGPAAFDTTEPGGSDRYRIGAAVVLGASYARGGYRVRGEVLRTLFAGTDQDVFLLGLGHTL